MAKTQQRMEQNGIIEGNPADFEAWETTVYLRPQGNIYIPKDIVRQLDLRHKDRVLVAIRKEKSVKLKP